MPDRAVVSDGIVAYPYGAISVRSRIAHHLTSELDVVPPLQSAVSVSAPLASELDVAAPLRSTLGLTGSLTADPHQDGGAMPYRDDRTCYVNASRRVTLRDFANDGVLVTNLGADEYIRYTVYRENGSVYQATQPLTYGPYWTDDTTTGYGWTAVFPAPAAPEMLKLVYEAWVDGKREFWVDSVEVVAF